LDPEPSSSFNTLDRFKMFSAQFTFKLHNKTTNNYYHGS
jgi:hypothetical protein